MRVGIVGQKWLGAETLRLLRDCHEVDFVGAPAGDRLAVAATEHGLPASPTGRRLDLLVAAHATWRIPAAMVENAVAAIGYHPSLLPRHRGRGAVEATIRARDAIAGGTIYHLTAGLDTGPVVSQDWCFVRPGIEAAALWRESLAPMGLRLLMEAAALMEATGALPAAPQDEAYATWC